MIKYNTRIAPSPTGMMHIGTARTAIFNYLAAKSTGGKFILRIDDTDVNRNQTDAIQPILDGLIWLGLDWDEIQYQSKRLDVYSCWANILVEYGFATVSDNGAILLNSPNELPPWQDEIKGEMTVTADMIDKMQNLVLLRGDGAPTYNFASILDDYLMDITYVIRGVDHISNTPKQIAVWNALNKLNKVDKPLPKFAHVGLIFMNGKKMSKRDGAASLLDYANNDYDPDAMFNFLIRMGWGPTNDDKSMTFIDKEKALTIFLNQGHMRSANSGFDQNKLDFYNRKYYGYKNLAT